MQLAPLGTNGYFPSHGRQTMSFLVLTAKQALLLDAGTGVARLLEPPVAAAVAGYRDLDIVLSHYHLDHVAGLSYLPAVWPRGRIRIFGPADPMVESDPRTALERLLAPPLFPVKIEAFPAAVELIPVREHELRIGELQLRCWAQPHAGGSMGIRIGDEIAYVTDTGVDAERLEWVRGVRLLMHELWLTDEEAAREKIAGHSSLGAVAGYARQAGANHLMLVHHHPRHDNDEVRRMAERVAELAGIPATPGEEGRFRDVAAAKT